MGSDIAAYDYCAFILLCIIVVYYFRTSVHGTNRVRIMAMIVVLTMAASVFDAARVRFASIREVSDIRFFAVNFGYLLLISSIPFMYLLYIVATTDTWHKLTKFKIEIVLCTIPMAVNVAILALNWTYPIAFEIGPDRTLTRHWGYYMIFFIFMLYGLIALAFLRKNVYNVDRKRYYVLLTPIIMVTVGLVIGVLARGHHVVCFSVAVCVLALVLINRRVEDSIDIVTGMHTYKVFAEDMYTNFSTGKQMEIILINITNFKYAMRMVGYDSMLGMMAPVSAEILRIMRKYHAQFMCYYNGDGKFAVELSRKNFTYAHEIAEEISNSIRQNIRMEISDFELEINTCLVRCPDDISD
ncbi:MAG: hypothetical protein IJ591_01030, partial [Lachnospiraceae bacterium]|nr:hypothetical protein [Lachnospiraceae bacterium]